MTSPALAIAALQTGKYGPLYVVSTRNPLECTPRVFLLAPGQEFEHQHSNLHDAQEIFGFVPGATRWTSNTYDWKNNHPAVKNGSAMRMVEQLIEAHRISTSLDMPDGVSRQCWLQQWSSENLGDKAFSLPLPDLSS